MNTQAARSIPADGGPATAQAGPDTPQRNRVPGRGATPSATGPEPPGTAPADEPDGPDPAHIVRSIN
ncbi:hypothetical protein LG634_16825 [Streptomyces bambusae]|uniref:hypothetical protein n=1 Tax=Streptomyces bambusae TaxID=1550616 RepID=UPI001CFD3538|nr:hypothetical protein [Streptomyces bambusae]MCB5166497.1 hypothetical protein [Streptomyces bambusae]